MAAAPRALALERRVGGLFRVGGLLYTAVLWSQNPPVTPWPVALLWACVVVLTVVLAGRLEARSTVGLAILIDLILLGLATLLTPASAIPLFPLLISLKALYLAAALPLAALLPLAWVLLTLIFSALRPVESFWQQPGGWLAVALLTAVAAATAWLAHRVGAEEYRQRAELGQSERRSEILSIMHRAASTTATALAAQVADLQNLQTVVQAVNSAVARRELLSLIERQMAREFEGSQMAILVRRERGRFELWPPSDRVLSSEMEGTLLELARRQRSGGRPLLVNPPGRSVMAVPLMVRDRQSGVLVAWRDGQRPFTIAHLKRLDEFAEQAALAVHNARLYEQLGRLLQESREREAQLATILKSIGDGVVVTTPEGKISRKNPAADEFLRLLNAQREERHAPFRAHVARVRAELVGDRGAKPLQADIHLSEGKDERHYHALSTPLFPDGGSPRGAVTVLRDVTDERQVEQLKSNFVSSVSHELRTPLHNIKNFVAALLNSGSLGPLTAQQRDFLDTVQKETGKLEQLVFDLLEFNRLESGPLPLNPTRFNLTSLLEEQMRTFQPHAMHQAITFESEIAQGLYVTADRRRVEQVVRNLLMNAFKFTPEGGTVELRGCWRKDGWLVISVADTGIGIDPAHQPRIFDRFYQVDSALSRRYPGMGVGLTLCRHIADQHGGHIWVESDGQNGSVFHLLLPPTPRPASDPHSE